MQMHVYHQTAAFLVVWLKRNILVFTANAKNYCTSSNVLFHFCANLLIIHYQDCIVYTAVKPMQQYFMLH